MVDLQEMSMMHEAVDYNALTWVRQEIDVTLRQAGAVLVKYSGDTERVELIHDCAGLLHQVRGLLQVAELEGAVLLVAEMESVVAGLLRNNKSQREIALKILMQSMQNIPAYLSRLQSSADDSPELVLQQVKVLRSVEDSMDNDAADSAVAWHVELPAGIFLGRKSRSGGDITARAHSARVQFQSALLAWYRGGPDKKGIDALAGVLGRLQEDAGSESEARLWWVGAGVADALSAGLLHDSREIKQLFGQLDRQIKRLVECGDVDFEDVQALDLLDSLLGCISGIESNEGRLAEILAACSMGRSGSDEDDSSIPATETESDAVLQNIDVMDAGDGYRGIVNVAHAWHPGTQDADSIHEADTHFQEILRGIALGKDAIEACVNGSGADGQLQSVPGVLDGVCHNLVNAGLDREAGVIASVRGFISSEMQESMQIPDEDRLNQLADAICSVEFYLECLRDGRIFGSRIIELAETRVAALGFPVHKQSLPATEPGADAENGSVDTAQDMNGRGDNTPTTICALQVIDPDADKEILEIFYDESDTELQTLRELVPRLDGQSDCGELLEEISRVFHTLKGNGRMLGAHALGELAYTLENLANNALNGSVPVDPEFTGLLEQACEAMSQLVDQIKDPTNKPGMDIDALALEALRMSRGIAVDMPSPAEVVDAVEASACTDAASESSDVGMGFPVLAADADPEIVEIFIEEADEEVAVLADIIPAWIACPDEVDCIPEVRRSMHTLKGSGRMAGALLMGEFAWSMEDLLNRVIDGSVRPDDAVYSLVNKLPSVLRQLTDQIRNGTEPTDNIRALMTQAAELRRNIGDASITDVSGSDEADEPGTATGSMTSATEPDYALLQIYTRECQEILDTIREYLNGDSEYGMVTEPLYRALHTLAGISESAEVGCIGQLASELDKYFSNLYHMQYQMPSVAFDVLRDSSDAIAELIEKIPDISGETRTIDVLCERIATLHLESETAADMGSATENAWQNDVSVLVESNRDNKTNQEDAFSNVDQELFEIFLEEAAEIQDASERVLHAWAAAPENHDSLTEYQRHLHTLKGSARMMNITAIGDLSHSIETLLTRVAENIVNPAAGLFSALFLAQDQLTDMLEQVRQHRMPEPCPDLETTLEQLIHMPSAEPGFVAECSINEKAETTADIHITDCDVAIESSENPEVLPLGGAVVSATDVVESCAVIESAGESIAPDEAMLLTIEEPAMNDMPVTRHVISILEQSSTVNEDCSIPLRPSEQAWPARKQKPARKRGELVKVQSELLDDLVNYAGEINIYRSRMETQIGDYRFNLGELEQTINRLREQLRKLEMETEAQVLYRYAQEADRRDQDFDPLELDRYSIMQESSRSLMESIGDLYSLLSLMENTTRDSETLLLQQSRISTDLHEGLMHTRMTPFAGLETRLKRIVRQSARQLDKKVDLELQGAEGEMDRAVIERIIAPLEHMLRNAVAHGIEQPVARVNKGKAEAGSITIAFDREGPDIVLRISDDGAGMDVYAIRAKAVERGLLDPDADISDGDVTQFVLQTGFTTASEVTQISGRGVGLDVVNSEVKQLGGSLHIESARDAGTVFTIRLPYTLAINQALLVKAGADTYCIPLGSVEGVVRVHPEELLAGYAEADPVYEYAGNKYQLKHLATLLNTDQLDVSQMSARVPLLLMRVADKRIALHIESLLGSREIVIKPVGVQLSSIDGITGATILGDGGVAMILDVFALSRCNTRAQLPVMRQVSRDEKRLVVMVVDDSITVRKVTTRLLERNGYKVLTAKDGVDATGQLQGCTPDIMLLDIEMPRMDGFELATHMRNDERLRHVPVIMITSRTGDKHRERARQIGVNYYLGKPYQEKDLLGTIDKIIRVTPDSSAEGHAEAKSR